jgi:hypothetical protein
LDPIHERYLAYLPYSSNKISLYFYHVPGTVLDAEEASFPVGSASKQAPSSSFPIFCELRCWSSPANQMGKKIVES